LKKRSKKLLLTWTAVAKPDVAQIENNFSAPSHSLPNQKSIRGLCRLSQIKAKALSAPICVNLRNLRINLLFSGTPPDEEWRCVFKRSVFPSFLPAP
jgi:hypothetical protein